MPNLEQSLLDVDYVDLPDIAADDECWDGCHPALSACEPGQREELCRILLDQFCRVLAIDVDVLSPTASNGSERGAAAAAGPVEPAGDGTPAAGRHRLARPGRLRVAARSEPVRPLRPRPLPSSTRAVPAPPEQGCPGRRSADLSDLPRVLERYGLLTVVIRAEDAGGAAGYRLKASASIWSAGKGHESRRGPAPQACRSRRGRPGQPVLPQPLPQRGAVSARADGARAHRAGLTAGPAGARGGLPPRSPAAAVLLADHGAWGRHRELERCRLCATYPRRRRTTLNAAGEPVGPGNPRS